VAVKGLWMTNGSTFQIRSDEIWRGGIFCQLFSKDKIFQPVAPN